uniref:Uncharacterized protein n=1 Tax=Arundo donax TaxID=35708 RepID=A0A0A9AZW9_ARUDO
MEVGGGKIVDFNGVSCGSNLTVVADFITGWSSFSLPDSKGEGPRRGTSVRERRSGT